MLQLDPDLLWFAAMAVVAALSWAAGVAFGRRFPRQTGAAIILSGVLLGVTAYLVRHPAMALQIVPLGLLRHVEGSAVVPFFLFLVGLILARAQLPRQKRVAGWATILGVVYFVQGSLWLIQPTPQVGFAETVQTGAVRQSADFTCVPAACATALNLLNHPTSEAEMVRLTSTRPGFGSTTVRALYGLNERLRGLGAPGRFTMLAVPAEGLGATPMPALTALKFEPTRQHMVTLLEIDAWGVSLEDPVDGRLYLPWDEFGRCYGGEVLVYREDPGLR